MQPQFSGDEDLGSADKRYDTLYVGNVDATGTITLGGGYLSAGGVLGKGAPSAATAGTSEEILASVVIPANTLSADGGSIRVRVFAHAAANGNNKTLRVRIGGISGAIVADSSTAAMNDLDIGGTVDVIRTGATTATAHGTLVRGTDSATAASTAAAYSLLRAAAVTWASANALVITGLTPTSAGDLTLDSYSVEVVR